MVDLEKLKEFLVEASSKTYAAGDSSLKTDEKDGSTTFEYKKGEWKYHDNFFGDEPFGGREVIFYKDKPVWMMTYYGGVYRKSSGAEAVVGFLRKALSNIAGIEKQEVPCRGPSLFLDGEYKYISNSMGEIETFTGEEFILKDGKEVYCAVYNGGLLG